MPRAYSIKQPKRKPSQFSQKAPVPCPLCFTPMRDRGTGLVCPNYARHVANGLCV